MNQAPAVRTRPEFVAESHGFTVRVTTRLATITSYRFFWTHHVTIENRTDFAALLYERRWRFIDADGVVCNFQGRHQNGLRPVIEPGALFGYTNFCSLYTPWGLVDGVYLMDRMRDGEKVERFEIAIPTFVLDSRFADKRLN